MSLSRVLITLTLCLSGRTAMANECNAYGPHTSTLDVPLGCPLQVVVPTNFTSYQPHVTTTRFDTHTGMMTTIDVTGTITRDPDIQLLVEEYRYDGTCELHDDGLEPQPFAEFEVALQGVELGDVLEAGASDPTRVHIVAAGPCSAFAAPQLACADPIQTQSCGDAGIGDPGGSNGGCNASGAAGPGLALALLACLRRRRTVS